MQEYVSKSKEQTQKIASDFAKKLKGGEVLCFYGNLGTGKTTFIQSLAKALGVKENITSPTFVLMKKYIRRGKACPRPNNRATARVAPTKSFFYHMDAYRLSNSQEAIDLGLEEIWSDPANIIAIEWADKIADILPAKKIDLCFDSLSENERKITVFRN
jgi:tRNA threonylcarbamoyladenosine biosynthesis protein TsaE